VLNKQPFHSKGGKRMANESVSETVGAGRPRTADDIRHDIARNEEHISHAVEEISDRIKEKLDWRGYVQEAPYLSIGAAAAVGLIAAGMLKRKPSAIELFMDSIEGRARRSLGGLVADVTHQPSLLRKTVLSISVAALSTWISTAVSTPPKRTSGTPPPREQERTIITPAQNV
jgi:ElaB/YqjD/DUF883 family membrane-anchored ribosome-binding protein